MVLGAAQVFAVDHAISEFVQMSGVAPDMNLGFLWGAGETAERCELSAGDAMGHESKHCSEVAKTSQFSRDLVPGELLRRGEVLMRSEAPRSVLVEFASIVSEVSGTQREEERKGMNSGFYWREEGSFSTFW